MTAVTESVPSECADRVVPVAAPDRVPHVSLEQLRTAWALLGDGWVGPPTRPWQPAEPTVLVLGCHGGAGASVLAVAVATASPGPARVLECAGPAHTGLAGAATAELGLTQDGGWAIGTRDQVTLCRRLADPRPLPPPAADATVTVVDVGAPGLAQAPWLREWRPRADVVVLVTTASTYGMRHLETVAAGVPGDAVTVVAVRGPAVRRWPKALPTGPTIAAARAAGHLVVIPDEKSLAWAGLETGPVPGGLLAAGRDIHAHINESNPTGEPQ